MDDILYILQIKINTNFFNCKIISSKYNKVLNNIHTFSKFIILYMIEVFFLNTSRK